MSPLAIGVDDTPSRADSESGPEDGVFSVKYYSVETRAHISLEAMLLECVEG